MSKDPKKIKKKYYEKELARLQLELVKLQEWIKQEGLRVMVVFEGRDAAGKGGCIKRIMQAVNPRICRVEALSKPTEKEQGEWYFQRYAQRFPSAGEMVLFDRSWYNRAGVERVLGFCSDDEYHDFIKACPDFENMIIRSGIILIKYWLSVDSDEQARRFQDRIDDPSKRWKLSGLDLEARRHWNDYTKARDLMFTATDTTTSPWNIIISNDKKQARLNLISHLLSQVDYQEVVQEKVVLPAKQSTDYAGQNLVDRNIISNY